MFAVQSRFLSERLAGLHEMERTQAADAFQRYEKLAVAYEAPRESAYPAAKRAKNICVKHLQTEHQELWSSTNVDFHKCEITQLSISRNVTFQKFGIMQLISSAKVNFNRCGLTHVSSSTNVILHKCDIA